MTPDDLRAALALACSRIDPNRADLGHAWMNGVEYAPVQNPQAACLAASQDVGRDLAGCFFLAFWAGVCLAMLMTAREQ